MNNAPRKNSWFLHGLLLITALILSMSPVQGEDDYPLRDVVEFTARDGLPNFFRKLEAGDNVTIAYLGGSITAQGGWRVQSLAWFQEQYPEATLKEVHAAIGGTGSDLGVFRVEKDALDKKPDLLFVEFAVNDSRANPEKILRAMEGIVRKTWQANPETDICFVYTMTYRESEQVANGKMKRSSSVMEEVADHYGIPSVNMGMKVAQMEKEGTLVMKTNAPMTKVSGDDLDEAAAMPKDEEGRIIFSKDGVHPYPETGHVLYTEALVRAMQELRQHPGNVAHTQGDPIREDNLENAKQLPIDEKFLSGPYENLTEKGDPTAKRFANRMSPMYCLKPAAEMHFKFKGTKAAVYDLVGPDGGILEVTIDGKTADRKRIDPYCTYHRLATLGIGDNLKDEVHDVTIRVTDKPLDKREILFEKNREDFDKNPGKYDHNQWYPGAIFIVGEIVEED